MRKRSQGNALLVELLIVVLFFMLASTVLLRVFAAAHEQGKKAQRYNDALTAAQNAADRLYAADDPEEALREMGFAAENEIWKLMQGSYTLEAEVAREPLQAGILRRQEVRAVTEDGRLVTLPCSRYEEGRP